MVQLVLVSYLCCGFSYFATHLLLCNPPCRLQVDYEFNTSTGTLEILHGKEHSMSNLSMLLQWSPFLTEAELLKQVSSFRVFFCCNLIFSTLHLYAVTD
jgi:hypothetical protein